MFKPLISFGLAVLFIGNLSWKMRSLGLQPDMDFLVGLGTLGLEIAWCHSVLSFRKDSKLRGKHRLVESPIFFIKHIVAPCMTVGCNLAYAIRIYLHRDYYYSVNVLSFVSMMGMVGFFLSKAWMLSFYSRKVLQQEYKKF